MAKQIRKPVIKVELETGNVSDLVQDRYFYGMEFAKQIVETEIFDTTFEECVFANCTFQDEIRSCMFNDVRFDHCDFSNLVMEENVFRRCVFEGCRLTGVNLSESRFQDVSICDSQAMYANFNGTHMKQVSLKNLMAAGASFSFIHAANLEISECDFSQCEFMETSLADWDFSSSRMDGVAVRVEDLKGVIVNEEQAIACAKLLGIVVKG